MTAFWRPGRPGQASRWWARCDHCRWSGPIERFTVFVNFYKGLEATICDHAWCDTPELRAQLELDGLHRGPSGYRGGK